MNYNKVKIHTVLQEILHLLRWFFSNYPDSSSKNRLVSGVFLQPVISTINRTQVTKSKYNYVQLNFL